MWIYDRKNNMFIKKLDNSLFIITFTNLIINNLNFKAFATKISFNFNIEYLTIKLRLLS